MAKNLRLNNTLTFQKDFSPEVVNELNALPDLYRYQVSRGEEGKENFFSYSFLSFWELTFFTPSRRWTTVTLNIWVKFSLSLA